MEPNPILEEMWRIKDELAREADETSIAFAQIRAGGRQRTRTPGLRRQRPELRRLAANMGFSHPSQRRP